MPYRLAWCVVATTLVSSIVPAATPDSVEPAVRLQRAAEAQPRRAYDTVRSLTERVGSRLAGSAGDARAVAWALDTLRAMGFENVHAEPVTVPKWTRGEAKVEIVGTDGGPLAALALGGSTGTDGTLEAPVIAVTSIDELAKLGRADVAGKIVFLYERMLETRTGMDYGPTVRNRSQGAVAAAKLGAVALVIRAVGSEDADRPHTGSMRYANGVPHIPAFAIGNHSADRLLARYALGPVRLRLSSTSRCEGTAQSANVIGEVPGRDARSGNAAPEVVVLGAHLDSWDVGTGAQDDAAGVATILEAARLVAALPERPARTLRVVLYANEEFGLSGGKQYALAHADELARHAAAIEADLGAGRVFRLESRVRTPQLPQALSLSSVLQPLNVTYAGNETGGGADIGPLGERGVPLFELQHDASKYFEIHHTDADRIDRVDPRDLVHNAAAYATVAWALADGPRFSALEREWPKPQEGAHPCDWQP